MHRGYIKLYRKTTDNPLWNIKPFSKIQAWIDLIFMANHKEKNVFFHQRAEHCQRGEIITSLMKLSVKWGWSRNKIRTYLNLLQKLDMILYNTLDKRFIKITICNYDIYQDKEDKKRQEVIQEVIQEKDKRRTREGQEKDINNNDNNYKKDKNDKNITIDYNFFKDEWNKKLTPKIISLTTDRKNKLKARCNNNIEFKNKYLTIIDEINATPFLRGENEKNWKADFDWVIKNDTNPIKILEGKYKQPEKIDPFKDFLDGK